MANILVVYGAKSYPLRATTQDHLYCFRRYSGLRCFYFNTLMLGKPWYRKIPFFLKQVPFDLIIFYLDLLNIQWPPYSLERFERRAEYFRDTNAIKIALAQDEFYNTDLLDRFIRDYEIDHVFSLAAESEWPKIYPMADFKKVAFHRVLPGYLDEKRLEQIDRISRFTKNRPFVIGYRAISQQNQPWLGRHGFKKVEIADLFEKEARKNNLVTSISTRAEDALLGNKWFKFLLQCRYTIAIEGGASILDHDGSIRRKTEDFLDKNPQASFEEVEKACFPGKDGELNYMAISPKHLEACATKTCQILVEGDYNGILKPGLHYIELKRDFSNLDEVLHVVKEDRLRSQITQNAFRDIVESGKYNYRTFVNDVLTSVLSDQQQKNSSGILVTLVYLWCRIFEIYQWLYVALLSGLIKMIRRFLPPRFENYLRKLVARDGVYAKN